MARKSRKNVKAPIEPKPPAVNVWRAGLYIRLSVEFNGKRGDSLETQRQIMEAYIALCPDIEIVDTYTDNGITGRTFEREGFQRMLEDVESGKINCIVVKDLSRLGRNAIDAGYYIEKYFPLHNVRFIAVNDQYDSEGADNSGEHIIVPLKNMMNEAYAADISRKVKAQLHQSMQTGDFVGAWAPYGYRKDPANCHKLLVNEETAPVVRQIFQWTIEGISINVIVKRLNEGNVLTPGFYLASIGLITSKHSMGSGKWQTWTVGKILSSEVYTGDMVQGKHIRVGYKQALAKPEDWVIVRNTHEPIISREIYAKVQSMREQAANKSKAQAKTPYTENILRGRVFCGSCGKNLHRQRHQCGYYIYHCISNDRIGRGTCKQRVYVREEELFGMILTIIRQEAENIIGNSLRLKQRDAKVAAQKAETEAEITRLRQETESNRAYQASLYQSFVSGVLTSSEYQELNDGYRQKIGDAVERVRLLQERQRELESQREAYFNLADRLAAVSEDTALTAALVDQVIERITVNGRDDVSIQFRFESSFDRLLGVLDDE